MNRSDLLINLSRWHKKREYQGPWITNPTTHKSYPDPASERNSGHWMRLPDAILDYLDDPGTQDGWMTATADSLAMSFYGVAMLYNALNDHLVYALLGGNVFVIHW